MFKDHKKKTFAFITALFCFIVSFVFMYFSADCATVKTVKASNPSADASKYTYVLMDCNADPNKLGQAAVAFATTSAALMFLLMVSCMRRKMKM
jgi:hypothetical protein